MNGGNGLKETVAEEVSEQVDLADVLGDGSIEDSVDGGEIGAAVGREFGESVGREFGESLGRRVHEALETAFEDDTDDGEETDDTELRTALVTAFRESVSDTLDSLEARDSIESLRTGLTGDEVDDTEDESDGDSETDADDSDATEDAESDGEAEELPDELDSDSIEGLRRETLVEFLETVSYSDLQSIAKDVDVKANLDRETMTDRIVETVTESAEINETAANEG